MRTRAELSVVCPAGAPEIVSPLGCYAFLCSEMRRHAYAHSTPDNPSAAAQLGELREFLDQKQVSKEVATSVRKYGESGSRVE